MKLKLATLLAVGAMVSISGAYVPTASAANINTMATQCRSSGGTQPAVTSAGVVNTTNSVMSVLCSMPRSPLAAGAAAGVFFIDGANPTNGGSTTCNVFSFDFTGTFLTGTGKVSTSPTYDLVITVNAAQLPTFAYTAVGCQIPPGGRLLGVTSVQ